MAEETGKVVSYPSYEAARRALGSRPGHELHHVVERAQGLSHRSGFAPSRINSTDNLVWIPVEAHRKISALYSTKVPGTKQTLRNSLNGTSWDDQYAIGTMNIEDEMRKKGTS
ncbi:MAG TPA: hypothetical protein VF444_21595 [Pseudonocardiaceae bacterium]